MTVCDATHGAVQVYLALLHVTIHTLRREHFRHVVVVGYSGVVFAWMTLVASGVRAAAAKPADLTQSLLMVVILCCVHLRI